MKIMKLFKLRFPLFTLLVLLLFVLVPTPVFSEDEVPEVKAEFGPDEIADPDENPYIGTSFTDPRGDPDDKTNGDNDIVQSSAIDGRVEVPKPPPKWPDATLIYKFDSGGKQFDTKQRELMKRIMDTITKKTSGCIRFREKTQADPHFAVFTKRGPNRGCNALIGYLSELAPTYRIDGGQAINLDDSCFSDVENLVPAHEMFHALGIFHEMRRPDRDSYVKVHDDRILQANRDSFKKNSKLEYYRGLLGLPFDFDSIMLYRRDGFQTPAAVKAKLNTFDILPKYAKSAEPSGTPSKQTGNSARSGAVVIGQRRHFSKYDIDRIMCVYDKCRPYRSPLAKRLCG